MVEDGYIAYYPDFVLMLYTPPTYDLGEQQPDRRGRRITQNAHVHRRYRGSLRSNSARLQSTEKRVGFNTCMPENYAWK